MNRQKFLAELSKLLGFMSSWDREAEINKYIAMLDGAEDEAELIESLGTPTQIAISVALGYKPTPRPGTQPPEPESPPEPEAVPESPESAAEPEGEAQPEPEAAPEPPPPPKKKRDEDEIVTDHEFDYGMELALLMGEPVAAAVESAFKGEYLPDPDLSLEEILREARGDEPAPPDGGEAGAEAETGASEETEAPEEAQTLEETASDAGAEAASGEEESEAEQTPTEAEAETEAEPAPEAENAGDGQEAVEAQPVTAGAEADEEADSPAPESEPETEEAEEEEAEAKTGTETESEETGGDGPVFDAATAPLPETVKSAGDEAAQAEQAGGDAAGPEGEAKHPPELVFDPANFAPLPEDVDDEDEEPDGAVSPRSARRPLGIVVYVLFSLVIGIPLTLLLILIGVPVLLAGIGIIAGTVYAATHIIAALSMVSDILLVAGTGLAVGGVGLLIAWLGLWLSIELGSLWISAVMLKLGRALCFKREADAE